MITDSTICPSGFIDSTSTTPTATIGPATFSQVVQFKYADLDILLYFLIYPSGTHATTHAFLLGKAAYISSN